MTNRSSSSRLTLPPSLAALAGLAGVALPAPANAQDHPNILLIMVDQMRTPPEGYGPGEGAVQDLKEILGFRDITPGNTYTGYFQGLMRLRQNSVVMKKHYTASAASVPSRCCIMTGQYQTQTGVTQTDGLFKSVNDVPFLDPSGTPTIGDWFRAAGYTTHYFGKWHVSDPEPPGYLEPWGFSDWESSYPEPHGGTAKNLGTYRDVAFTDYAVDFLNSIGQTPPSDPWLMVASLVNPHDISAWPINWQVPDTAGVVPWRDYPPVLTIPAQGDSSLWGTVTNVIQGDTVYKTFRVPLNPDGFPQGNSALPPTFAEDLSGKPQCQQDYAYKWGLAWGSNTDYTFINQHLPFRSPHPFQLQDTLYPAWSLSYIQFYFYCQYLADLQIRRILEALDNNHLTENTIVIFLSDHGDMTSAHGGIIQKWYNAYEESVRVPMIVSSPLVNSSQDSIRVISSTSSSIDMAPTLLGFAGYSQQELIPILEAQHGSLGVRSFPGIDLSPYIKGTASGPFIGSDGNPRPGVLFMASDMITGQLNNYHENQYNLFLSRVDSTIDLGYPLAPGPVMQPNNPRAFCTGDWKIVQYVDPDGAASDQWELYCLSSDPTERYNLDDYATGEVLPGASVPGMTYDQLVMKNDSLKNQLAAVVGLQEPGPGPRDDGLLRNFPNPFTGETTISFFLADPGDVQLSVADLSGRTVQTILHRYLTRGTHAFRFDGQQISPGVYLIMLESASGKKTGKMVRVE